MIGSLLTVSTPVDQLHAPRPPRPSADSAVASTAVPDALVIITPASMTASRQTLNNAVDDDDFENADVDSLGLVAVPFRREHSAPSSTSTRLSLSPALTHMSLPLDPSSTSKINTATSQPRGSAADVYLREFGLESIPFRRELSAPSRISSEHVPPSPVAPKSQARSPQHHRLDTPSASERVMHVAEQVRLLQLYSSPKRKASSDHTGPLPRGLRLLDVVDDSPNEREPSVAIL